MVCTGPGMVVAGAFLLASLQRDIFFSSWRPDRAHLFGRERLAELARPVDILPLELLRGGVPRQAPEAGGEIRGSLDL
jgi:hypothetical protein